MRRPGAQILNNFCVIRLRMDARAITCAVVILCCMCLIVCMCKEPPLKGIVGRVGRRVAMSDNAMREFSWTNVTSEQSAWFDLTYRRQVPPGIYASAPINQHLHAWCGVCWLVACVQAVQDKLNIREAPAESQLLDHRAFVFDMQAAADDAAHLFAKGVHRRETGVGMLVGPVRQWTACMGGDPKMALDALKDGSLRLAAARLGTETWQSRSDATKAGRVEGDNVVRAVRVIRPTPHDLKHELLEGPVVVCTRSAPLWSLDELGRTPSGTGERDHVMVIVGWTRIGDVECWVTRNSWGSSETTTVHSKPSDVRGCAGGLCKNDKIEWKSSGGLYGYVYIPVDFKENSMGVYDEPSGCFAIDV